MANQFTRDDLAKFLPSTKLIRAFEDLTNNVDVTLPDQIEAVSIAAQQALAAAIADPDTSEAPVQALDIRVAALEAATATEPVNQPRDLSQDFADLQAFTYGTSPWL